MTDPQTAEMFVFESWREDSEKEDGGVWFDGPKGLRVKVRSARSQYLKDILTDMIKKAREDAGGAALSDQMITDITDEVYGRNIVADWENFYKEAPKDPESPGKPTPFSTDLAKEMWIKSRRWKAWIDRLASNDDRYTNEVLAEKN